jgi:hypothetical protein
MQFPVSLLSPWLEWRDTLRLLCTSHGLHRERDACWHALAPDEQALLRHVRGDERSVHLPLHCTEVVWLACSGSDTLYVGTSGPAVLCVRQGRIARQWHLPTLRGWPTRDGGVVVHGSTTKALLAIAGPDAQPVRLAWRADVACVAPSGRMLTMCLHDVETRVFDRTGFPTKLRVGIMPTRSPSAVTCVQEVFVYVCDYGNVNALWPSGHWETLPLPGGPAAAVVGAWRNRFLAVASTGARYVCDIAGEASLRLLHRCPYGPPPRAQSWMAGRYAVCAGQATDLRSGYGLATAPDELAGPWSAAIGGVTYKN